MADEIENTPDVQTGKGSDNVEALSSQNLMTPENFAALDNSAQPTDNVSKKGFPGPEDFGSQSTDWATKSGKQSLKSEAKAFENAFPDQRKTILGNLSGLA
ncbi:MAG: hypothetical protein K2X77_20525 [Candidatus Obscuribacterales bacterium]|jgi:hypothetical protein|nr:hypothetical protein [Candidatus Obscuribacterales bacterium]